MFLNWLFQPIQAGFNMDLLTSLDLKVSKNKLNSETALSLTASAPLSTCWISQTAADKCKLESTDKLQVMFGPRCSTVTSWRVRSPLACWKTRPLCSSFVLQKLDCELVSETGWLIGFIVSDLTRWRTSSSTGSSARQCMDMYSCVYACHLLCFYVSRPELHMDELTRGNLRFEPHVHSDAHKHVHFFHRTEIQMQ